MNVSREFEIAILAKAPIAGYAKTRLIPLLGAEEAAWLQAWLLRRIVATAEAARLPAASGTAVNRISLWCVPDCDHPGFLEYSSNPAITRHQQPAGDIGWRMLAAARRNPSASGTIIVGTDCPTLTPSDIAAAAQALCECADAAVIPAADGGYVLIAVRQPYAALFSGIDWSTPRVMIQTRQRATAAGVRLVELPSRPDVDHPEDLLRAIETIPELRERYFDERPVSTRPAPHDRDSMSVVLLRQIDKTRAHATQGEDREA